MAYQEVEFCYFALQTKVPESHFELTREALRSGRYGGGPFLTEGLVTASLTVFFLGENSDLCLSELFSLTTGVELKRMGSEQGWPRRPADLFLSDGARRGAGV